EAGQQRTVPAAERLDVRPAAGADAGDDVGEAVAVHVAGRHVHAASEVRGVGHELADQVAGPAVEDLDVRAAAGAGRGDEVVVAVGDVLADHGVVVPDVVGPVGQRRRHRAFERVGHGGVRADHRAQGRHVGRLQLGGGGEPAVYGERRQPGGRPLLVHQRDDLVLDVALAGGLAGAAREDRDVAAA